MKQASEQSEWLNWQELRKILEEPFVSEARANDMSGKYSERSKVSEGRHRPNVTSEACLGLELVNEVKQASERSEWLNWQEVSDYAGNEWK